MKILDLQLPIAALSAVLFSSVRAAEDVNILTTEIAREQNSSLLWGPYRPNVYFGVRPRIPKSFTGGLMWAKVDDFVNIQNSKLPAGTPPWILMAQSSTMQKCNQVGQKIANLVDGRL